MPINPGLSDPSFWQLVLWSGPSTFLAYLVTLGCGVVLLARSYLGIRASRCRIDSFDGLLVMVPAAALILAAITNLTEGIFGITSRGIGDGGVMAMETVRAIASIGIVSMSGSLGVLGVLMLNGKRAASSLSSTKT